MSKQRRPPLKLPRIPSFGSTDAMKSMIRLALSLRGPEGEVESRIRSAMDAFGRITPFDAWLVGTIESSSTAPAAFTRLMTGGPDAKVVDDTTKRWTTSLSQNQPALRPLFSGIRRKETRSEPLVRVWQDSIERSLLSIQAGPRREETIMDATWISLHRLGASSARFQLRERRWLSLLHEQCAAVMHPA